MRTHQNMVKHFVVDGFMVPIAHVSKRKKWRIDINLETQAVWWRELDKELTDKGKERLSGLISKSYVLEFLLGEDKYKLMLLKE